MTVERRDIWAFGVEAFDAISVFSPLGSALLRLGLGQTIDWNDEVGQDRRVTVVSILPRGSA
jgi:transcription elongation GreA/GreB family factor